LAKQRREATVSFVYWFVRT